MNIFRWSAHKYAIELNGDQWMNLPAEYVGLSNYRATLGHFVNHSFRETNAEFVPAFHPRFGDILAVRHYHLKGSNLDQLRVSVMSETVSPQTRG